MCAVLGGLVIHKAGDWGASVACTALGLVFKRALPSLLRPESQWHNQKGHLITHPAAHQPH
eukprot:scaffold308833_cov24-Tisochrysis_lutea.AAC.1